MLNIAQLSGLISAALMLWSGTNLALDDYDVHTTGVPALQKNEKPVARVQVNVEPISKFDTYYLNQVNPFVPYGQRTVERKRMWERENRGRNRPPREVPIEKQPVKPPKKPVVLPKLTFEPIQADNITIPEVIGKVATAESYLVFVRLGDEQKSMKPGDTIGGWTMVKMENGQVIFKDPDGEVLKVNGVSGTQANTVGASASTQPKSGGSTSPAGVLGGGKSSGMNPQKMIEMLKDPVYAEAFKRQLKSDPNLKKMLMNPTVLRMLREQGLEHLIK